MKDAAGAIFDLGDEQRPHEDSALAPERDLDRVQQLTQLVRFLIAQTSAAAADVNEADLSSRPSAGAGR